MFTRFLPFRNDNVHYICRLVFLFSQLSHFQQNVNIGDYCPTPILSLLKGLHGSSNSCFFPNVIILVTFFARQTATVKDFVFFDSVGTFSEPISEHDPFHETAHPLDHRLVTVSFFFLNRESRYYIVHRSNVSYYPYFDNKEQAGQKAPRDGSTYRTGFHKTSSKIICPILTFTRSTTPPASMLLTGPDSAKQAEEGGGNCSGGGMGRNVEGAK